MDYRKLNKLTVFDRKLMATAKDLFQKMSGDKYFSKLDQSKRYWQIILPEEDIPETAFVTPDGSYEFFLVFWNGLLGSYTKTLHEKTTVRFGLCRILQNKVEWGKAQEKAYLTIKTLLTNKHVPPPLQSTRAVQSLRTAD